MTRWIPVFAVALLAPLTLADDLLPNMIVRQNDLYDHDIVFSNGLRLLRLSNGTPNIGLGKLYMYGSTIYPDGTQDVYQRIYRTDGTWWDRLAGKFVYHPTHQHIHFEGWAEYRLREVLPGGGVGAVVAMSDKTSFCLLDVAIYDSSLPNFNPSGQFHSCGASVQGISVGWLDIYSKTLDGQAIDTTGLPIGEYWLESEVDPDNQVLESDDSDNIKRILVQIDSEGIPLDAYEPNNSRTEVDARPSGGASSPNLGPCNPETTIAGLTVQESANDDYFKFYLPATGGVGDLVRIAFEHDDGDLDMKLLNAAGTTIATSEGTTDVETISLWGRPAGFYYVRVYGYQHAVSPDYTLTINPSANGAPGVTVTAPPPGDIKKIHGFDTYTVTWVASDPESNPTWVTVYLNTQPTLDGNEIIIPTSLHTDGALGFAVVNSAYVPPGTYWAYCEITDGGTTAGAWSPGTVTFEEPCNPCDTNCDGSVNGFDVDGLVAALSGNPSNCSPCNSDANGDGSVNGFDVEAFLGCLEEP